MRSGFACVAAVVLAFGVIQAKGQSITFNFQDATDQGFGKKFSNDASTNFNIVNIAGSLRMQVGRTGAFQEAERSSTGGGDPFLAAINAAMLSPGDYNISYDWYVDTSPGNFGTFLQLGTYINAGSGGFAQDFPGSGKDVELNGTQLASGGIFSGTVTETVTQKYGALDPTMFQGQTFMRFGLIMNGDGTGVNVYFDNISFTPIPEPSSLSLLGLMAPVLWVMRRRRSTRS